MKPAGKWQPTRVDAQLVGSISRNVQLTLSKRVTTGSCRVRQVYTVPETVEHYHTRHSHEFDVEKAEELLPTVLARPLYVFVGKKSKSVTFVGEFDDEHYLMIPIKVLTHELWLESLYIRNKRRLERSLGDMIVLYRSKRQLR